MDELNPAQTLFCTEYLKDFNATQAAIRAGYSEKTARQQGSRLLTNVDVQNELSIQIGEMLKLAKIPLEKQIYDMWVKRAFYDITDIISTTGKMKSQASIKKKGLEVCIDSINKKLNAQGKEIITYEFANRDVALEKLQKYIQMIKEKVEISGGLQLIKITDDEEKALT